jgi:hypothetical protein
MTREIKGIVRPPMRMPDELLGPRSGRAIRQTPKVEVPLLVRLFVWYCFVRAGSYLAFAMIVGLTPESTIAVFLATHFDPVPAPLPAEAVFFLLAILYTVVGWRWFTRDWRARWAAMFLSGANAAAIAVNMIADRAAGHPESLAPPSQQATIVAFAFNLLLCCYLAFYPGMEQAFRETPWD